MLIDELLVVCDNGLGDGLTDGVDLRSVSTSSNSDADIDVGELIETDNEERLVHLKSKDLRLDEVERLSVNLDEALSACSILLVFLLLLHRCVLRLLLLKLLLRTLSLGRTYFCTGRRRWRSSSCRSIERSVLRP